MKYLNNKYNFIIIALIICTSIFLICNNSSDNTTLDEVRLKDEVEVSKKQFAMYTRDSEDSDYTEYTGDDLFPKGYKLNEKESKCMDNNGEDITTEEVISQTEDGKIMVTSTKTVYCTFYFDKEITASEKLTTNPSSYLKKGDHGDLKWRYVGNQNESESINNYVCFGASSCSSGATDNHLYRIIGITEQGNLKIQKNSSIGAAQWHNLANNTLWPQSTMYTSTLQTFYNGNLLTSDMKDKVEKDHKWNTGDIIDYNSSTSGSYGQKIYEQETSTTHIGAIGLAYLSDYYYAYDENGMKKCTNECKSWMIPSDWHTLWSNNENEWTMSRVFCSQSCAAWSMYYGGWIAGPTMDYIYAVRPVLYLINEITISSGSGSLDDPYIIN